MQFALNRPGVWSILIDSVDSELGCIRRGRIEDFHLQGALTHITSRGKPEVPYGWDPGPTLGLWSSRIFDALSCYLCLIFMHSIKQNGIWRKKHSLSIFFLGGAPAAPPHLDPPLFVLLNVCTKSKTHSIASPVLLPSSCLGSSRESCSRLSTRRKGWRASRCFLRRRRWHRRYSPDWSPYRF